MRREQRVKAQLPAQGFIEYFHFGVNEQHGPMRVRQHVFYEPVAALTLRIGEAVKEAIALRVFDQVIQVALLLVAKCFAITDKKLKVARVRLIDARIVNLIDDAVTKCEPETATGMISRTHAFFRARSPARLDSRRAERCGVLNRIHN